MTPRLDGKITLITGGTRGIGRAVAQAFAAAGATVVVNGRSPESTERAASELSEGGAPVFWHATDVTDAAAVQAMIGAVVDAHGHLDILVHSAGISPFYKRAEDITEAEWDQVLTGNAKSAFLCDQAAGRTRATWAMPRRRSLSSLASSSASAREISSVSSATANREPK